MMGCDEYNYEGQFIADADLADGRGPIVKVDILPDVLPEGPSPLQCRCLRSAVCLLITDSANGHQLQWFHCFACAFNLLETWCSTAQQHLCRTKPSGIAKTAA